MLHGARYIDVEIDVEIQYSPDENFQKFFFFSSKQADSESYMKIQMT